jgi:hypothetical protein
MMKYKLAISVIVSVIFASMLAPNTSAQSIDVVEAFVDRDLIYLDEQLTLTVVVNTEGAKASLPELPPLGAFTIVSSSTGSQISIINGQMSTQAYYQYTLQARQIGEQVIDPIKVTLNGNTYNSIPIKIQVEAGPGQTPPRAVQPSQLTLPGFQLLQPGGMPSIADLLAMLNPGTSSNTLPRRTNTEIPQALQGQDYYLEAKVDNAAPYQGDQVVYTLRYFRAVAPYQEPSIVKPSFSGFWKYDESGEEEYLVTAAGRDYFVHEMSVVLFPTVAGEVIIDPAQVVIPPDAYTRGGTLVGDPVGLNVMPLPQPVPDDFSGAVGYFLIHTEVDVHDIEIDGTVTLRTTLQGIGNLEAAIEPEWVDSDDWRSFDSSVERLTQVEDGQIVGVLQSERILIPSSSGQLSIPSIQYIFFNPATGKYETTSTEPILITVHGEQATNPQVLLDQEDSNSDVNRISSLRPLKDNSKTWGSEHPALVEQNAFWVLWSIPVLLLVGYFSLAIVNRPDAGKMIVKRKKKAERKAHLMLKQTVKDRENAYEVAERALHSYLQDKFGISIRGLRMTEIGVILEDSGVPRSDASRVMDMLTLCESMRYAPISPKDSKIELFDEVEDIIHALEESLDT